MTTQSFTEFYGRKHSPIYWSDLQQKQLEYEALHPPSPEALEAIANGEPLPDIEDYELFQKPEALRAKKYLERGLALGLLSQEHVRGRILDFGCGKGGSTLFMLQFADVTGVDIDEPFSDFGKVVPIPEGRFYRGDGVKFMHEQDPQTYDLITAFLYGFINYNLTPEFVSGVQRTLKPSGRLLVMSDLFTMDNIRGLLKKSTPTHWNEASYLGKEDLEGLPRFWLA